MLARIYLELNGDMPTYNFLVIKKNKKTWQGTTYKNKTFENSAGFMLFCA